MTNDYERFNFWSVELPNSIKEVKNTESKEIEKNTDTTTKDSSLNKDKIGSQ